MNARLFLSPLISLGLCLAACESAKPPVSPAESTTTTSTPSTSTTSTPATTAATPTTAPSGGMKECTCTAAPTEACSPNCPPIKWQSADCDSPVGRPRACKEPATKK